MTSYEPLGYSDENAATTRERVYFDGILLNTFAWNISTGQGRGVLPARRGDFLQVPGRSGTLPVFNRPTEALEETWTMWVQGCAPDGSRPESESMRATYWRNNEMLQRLFSDDSRLHNVEVHKPDGSRRYAQVAVVDTIDFSEMAGRTRAEFSVTLTVPEGVWKSAQLTVEPTFVQQSNNLRVYSLEALKGSTAPNHNMTLFVQGPISNFSLFDALTGISFTYYGSLSDSDVLVIDTTRWSAKLNYTTSVLAQTMHEGHSRLFILSPRSNDSFTPKILLYGDNMTANTKLSLSTTKTWWTS